MDIEVIKTELFSKMNLTIERLHKLNQNQGGAKAAVTGEHYIEFKKELKSVINYLIDKHKIEFQNSEDSNSFLHKLLPTIEDLLNKYFNV